MSKDATVSDRGVNDASHNGAECCIVFNKINDRRGVDHYALVFEDNLIQIYELRSLET